MLLLVLGWGSQVEKHCSRPPATQGRKPSEMKINRARHSTPPPPPSSQGFSLEDACLSLPPVGGSLVLPQPTGRTRITSKLTVDKILLFPKSPRQMPLAGDPLQSECSQRGLARVLVQKEGC